MTRVRQRNAGTPACGESQVFVAGSNRRIRALEKQSGMASDDENFSDGMLTGKQPGMVRGNGNASQMEPRRESSQARRAAMV